MFPFSCMHRSRCLNSSDVAAVHSSFDTSGCERPWGICTPWWVIGSMWSARTSSWYSMVDSEWPFVAGYSWKSCPVTWQAVALCKMPLPCRDHVEVIQVAFRRHFRFTCCLPLKLYIQAWDCPINTGAKFCGKIHRLHSVLTSSLWKYKLDSQVRTFLP